MRHLFQKKNLTFLWIAVFLIGGFFVFTNGIFASSVEVPKSVVAENQIVTPVESITPVIAETTSIVDISTPIEPVVETTEIVATNPVATDLDSTSNPTLTEEVLTPDVLTEATANQETTIILTEAQATPVETWLNNGSKFTTVSSVELGKTYIAPQNNQVTVTFTKLPENPGTLSIEEITLTPEQIILLGALSDKAYDITSDMVDGTFEFDLTLPKPANQESAEIKFAETISDLKNAETVAGNEIKIESDSVKASFDHFTFFVVTKESGSMRVAEPIASNVCIEAGATHDNGCFFTIQEAIDAASEGDVIKVYPGNYNETALNRTLSTGGTYQFGLFVGTDKNNITIEGVDIDGNPITDATNPNLPYITTNATNNFGPSSIFIVGNNVTISGVHIGPNSSGENKTIEVIGDNFTLQYSKTSIPGGGGSVYINDFSTEGNIVKSYHILDNIFYDGTSVDIASGAGLTGPVSDREILRNKFDLGNNGYNAISFNGAGGTPWYTNPVGGAIISGNEFKNSTQYIRARGTYDNSQFDWKSYWDNNTFDKKVVDLSDLATFTIQPFSYTDRGYTFTNVRRIGAIIQPEINNAQAGNIINIGQGTFLEQLNIDKNLTLIGDAADKTIIKAPAVMVKNSFNQNNIVEIKNNATTNISNVTISGPGSSNCGSMNNGLYIIGNATLNISDSKISNIRDSVFSGCQNGVAIFAGQRALSQSGHAIIDRVTITDYQKGGIVIDGLGSTATITNNIITGAGTTNVTAQNGIQISRGATATLSGNTITGNSYHLDSNAANWSATGVLLYQSGSATMTGGNKIFNNDLNIYKYSSGSLAVHGNYIGASTAPVGVGAGIGNEDSDLVDATNNWWGNQSGPKDSVKSDGSIPDTNNYSYGSAAMGAVSYFPWCIDSSCSQNNTVKAVMGVGPFYVRANNSTDVSSSATIPVTASSSVVVVFHFENDITKIVTDVVGYEHIQSGQWPHDGLSQYRAKSALPLGVYKVTASYTVNQNTYNVNGGSVTYVLGNTSGNFVIPSAISHYFRTSDNPLRIVSNDVNNQFSKVIFRVNNVDYTVNRAQCDLREAGKYILCDVNKAINWAELPEGEYTAIATIYNQAQNRTTLNSIKFIIDNTRPVLQNFHINNLSSVYGDSIKISADATDNNGIKNVTFYITAPRVTDNACDGNGAQLASIEGTLINESTYEAILDTAKLNGAYCLNAIAEDVASSHSNPILRIKANFDNTAPTVSLIFPIPGPWARSFQAVFNEDVDVIDATNPANYFLSNWPGAGGSGDLMGDAIITYDTDSKTATINLTNSDWYISAEQQWGVQNIHNLAGTVQEPILVASYSTPMLAPVTMISLNGTLVEDVYTSSVTIALNATDGDSSVGSGVKATYYSINDAEFIAGTSVLIETNGDYNIRYYSEDNAGNVEAEKNITFKINIQNNNEDTTLADAKLLALEALAQAFATYNNTDYTDENWLALSGFNADGITAINAATTLEEIASAKTTAIDGMAGVEKKTEQPTRIITTNFGGGGAPISYCSNVEYGEWGTAVNGIQQRGILSRTPNNCSLSPEQQLSMARPLPIIQQVLGEKKYADGTLLKGTNNRIYVVIGGKLLYITNFKELAKYHGPILKVSDEVINSFAKLSVLGVKKFTDGTLIRAKGDIKVYIIKNGKKVQIKTLVELKKYKGVIYTVTAEELSNY